MKTLKFRPHLAEMIMAGTKTTTWRLYDDKSLLAGDELLMVDSETGARFAEAVITEVREKTLGEISETDYSGNQHERFHSHEEMLATYRRYYGEKVDDTTLVKIIKFKLK